MFCIAIVAFVLSRTLFLAALTALETRYLVPFLPLLELSSGLFLARLVVTRAHSGFSDSWEEFPARTARVLCALRDGGAMARAYSQDLRDRMIDAALGGMPARRAAAQFEIGAATAIVWVRRARASGERTARRQGQPRRSKLDPQRDFLLALVEQRPLSSCLLK